MDCRVKKIFLGTILFVLAAPFFVSGEVVLDENFGENGLVLTEIGTGLDQAVSVAVQDDGKVVVAGISDNGFENIMALVRYTSAGQLDGNFQFTAGSAIDNLYGEAGVHSIVLDPDGAIVLGGYITDYGTKKGALVRVLQNGQLDVGFGQEGIAVIDLDGIDSDFKGLAVMIDGSYTAVGFTDDGDKESPLIARFNGDGTADITFAPSGIKIDSLVSGSFLGLGTTADGEIISCGYVYDDSGRRGLYLARYDNDGLVDEAFGDAGSIVTFDDAEEIIAHDADIDSTGGVVLTGRVVLANNENRIMLARFDTDGEPDTTFSENGILVHDIGNDSAAYSINVVDDNTIVAAGYRTGGADRDVVILKYDPYITRASLDENSLNDLAVNKILLEDEPVEIIKIAKLIVDSGSLDFTSRTASEESTDADLITTKIEGSDDIFRSIAVTDAGAIYSAGSSGSENESTFLVARYLETARTTDSADTAETTISEYYRLVTLPVTGITRVGALTGGEITSFDSDSEQCLEECEAACSGTDEEITECEEACAKSCDVPAIVKRGVVYSVDPHPEYDADEADDDSIDDASDDSDVGDDESIVSSGNFFDLDNYYVLHGQTDDGAGSGSFTSEIDGVNPQTEYYVRAYCEFSDGTIIYGNEYQFKTDDACFIATASFGSIDMFAVHVLRQFRDRYLLTSEWGKRFVKLYYSVSPAIADIIAKSYFLRICVIILLVPTVITSIFLLYIGMPVKCVMAGSCVFGYLGILRKKYGIVHG